MKRLCVTLICLLFICVAQGQKPPTIKAGSIVSVVCPEEIRAKKVNVGDLVSFEVDEPFIQRDSVLIPVKTKVYAKVLVAKKSGIAGTKGKLKIEWLYIQMSNGVKIPLEGEFDFARKNHTTGSIVAAAVVAAPLIFLTGQHAVIKKGQKLIVTVKQDTEL